MENDNDLQILVPCLTNIPLSRISVVEKLPKRDFLPTFVDLNFKLILQKLRFAGPVIHFPITPRAVES